VTCRHPAGRRVLVAVLFAVTVALAAGGKVPRAAAATPMSVAADPAPPPTAGGDPSPASAVRPASGFTQAPPASPLPTPPELDRPQPEPSPAPAAGPGAGDGGVLGGLFDVPKMIGDAITSLIGMLVEQAEKPVFALLGDTLLSTPDVTGNPVLAGLWSASLGTAGAAYVLFVLVGGVLVMGYETVQTRYALKQIAPRLVIGLAAAASSLTVLGKAIALANAASQAILGSSSVSGKGVAQQWLAALIGLPGGGLLGPSLALIELALIFGVLVGYTVRVALIAVLAACAPLALSCHALPVTEGIARLWWRAVAGCLVIQLAQSTVFIVGLKLYFAPGNTVLGLPNPSQLSNLLAGLCLFWVLVKIPGWTARVIFRATPITLPGTPLPLRILRSVALAALLRGATPRVTRTPPARPGRGPTPPGPGPHPGPGRRPGPGPGRNAPGPPGPGSGSPSTSPTPPPPTGPPTPSGTGGTAPTSGGPTVSPPPSPSSSGPPSPGGVPHPAAARRKQQLTLPIPATKTPARPAHPVQTWLPVKASRQPRASTPPPLPAPPPAPRLRGRQTALPIPATRVRLRPPRPVQMRLPLDDPSTPPRRR
jgi:hypothetical protein